ncbi:uncharacterized protein ColSpa_08247 [Colletotrichum spaethianum]|uniref:Uncharacterized protein n=1 Tax=Colletotrichum spaethianum TaxID=700344 RepID=A0AA37P9E1_9PEZI|nr:uncharacterized protein ColSpa_08247 [Colletotrichum spaethianum]GKT48066.1 hypothetical protein ColSpa_08247 [Colletotrichum spaethianum]
MARFSYKALQAPIVAWVFTPMYSEKRRGRRQEKDNEHTHPIQMVWAADAPAQITGVYSGT